MKKFAFITRHTPTPAQFELAQEQGIELIPVGDEEAFAFNPADYEGYAGVVVVHPWMAMRANNAGLWVGIFENANRAPEGERPQFEAVRLHVMPPIDWEEVADFYSGR